MANNRQSKVKILSVKIFRDDSYENYACPQISHILWNLKINCRADSSLPLAPMLRHINPVFHIYTKHHKTRKCVIYTYHPVLLG